MPIIKSAKKAARQSIKRKSKNEAIKKEIRNALKDFRKKPTAEKMAKVQSEYDKAVKKGLIKKNTANRRKANLVKIAKAANMKIEKKAAAKKAAPAAKPAEKKAPAKKATTAKAPAAKKATAAKKPAAKKAPAKKAAEK